MGEWIETSLADVASSVAYGYTESASTENVGPRFLRITDIQNGRVNWDSVPFCPISEADHLKYRLQSGDIVVARTGNSTGENFLFRGDVDAVFASYLIRFRLDPEKACPAYVWYNMRASKWWEFISSSKTGSAQAGANAKVLGTFPLTLPPLPEQRAIAHILGTLDDKIELNRRMNETLEAMARALFKSWFVDFLPVRAKTSGNAPPGNARLRPRTDAKNSRGRSLAFPGNTLPGNTLPKHIADLFPDKLVDSELGEIPEGWRVGSVDDEFNLTMGQSPPGSTYNEDGVGLPFYQGRTDFGFRFPTRRVYCTAPSRFATAGDTLISVRAPVGDVNVANEDCAIGRGVAAARHKSGSRSYTFQFMRSIKSVFDTFEAEGTVFGSIGKKDFHAIRCVLPPRGLVAAFERTAGPLDEKVSILELQSRTLSHLRDTLLPKLISGELRVGDAERFVGEVV